MNAPENAPISTWLVSNRLPYRLDDQSRSLERTDGGLVTALLPVHQGGSSWWVGQGGFPDSPELASRLETERVVDVAIPAALAKDHYSGASNGGIWPLFHYFPEIAVFLPAEWAAYRAVNQAFADAILARAKPGDRVWIHDYQLMLLPAMLRAREARLVIGYFHHIPFPASEVLKIHPARDELINGLLGADLVGFHTLEYARHFAGSAARLLGVEAVAEELHVEDRLVRVGAFPLGIDAEGLLAAMDTAEHALAKERILSQLGGRRLILGVDRLDYTKGILERLAAFERFLRTHPEWRDRVTFVQLCVPSRIEVERYERLRQAVEREVGRINGELGSTGHAPVHYLFQRRGLDDLTALYRVADVCLVTPLRDGLNLVCKEYAAASEDLDAVLVLSEFAGAAEEMGEALVVNPYDTEAVAAAIARALEMPLAERRRRMGALRQRVLEADNRDWARGFLQALDEIDRRNRANASRALEGAELERQRAQLRGRLALAAFDADILDGGDDRSLRQAVACALRAGAQPVVISSLPRAAIDARWSGLPAWMAAERGAFVRDPAGAWLTMPPGEPFDAWRTEVRRYLDQRVRVVPRSYIAENEASLHWHVGRRPSALVDAMLRETAHMLDGMLARGSWQATRAVGGLVVRSANHNAGTALDAVAQRLGLPADAQVLTVGDRFSDDALFRWRADANCSIAVGTPVSAASFLVANRGELGHALGRMLGDEHA